MPPTHRTRCTTLQPLQHTLKHLSKCVCVGVKRTLEGMHRCICLRFVYICCSALTQLSFPLQLFVVLVVILTVVFVNCKKCTEADTCSITAYMCNCSFDQKCRCGFENSPLLTATTAMRSSYSSL